MPLTMQQGQFILFAISGIERITFPAPAGERWKQAQRPIARGRQQFRYRETTKGAGLGLRAHSWLPSIHTDQCQPKAFASNAS